MEILTTQVVLACVHIDHDPQNNAPKNLKALCQRCHILHDKEEHLRQRWFTYRLPTVQVIPCAWHPLSSMIRPLRAPPRGRR